MIRCGCSSYFAYGSVKSPPYKRLRTLQHYISPMPILFLNATQNSRFVIWIISVLSKANFEKQIIYQCDPHWTPAGTSVSTWAESGRSSKKFWKYHPQDLKVLRKSSPRENYRRTKKKTETFNLLLLQFYQGLVSKPMIIIHINMHDGLHKRRNILNWSQKAELEHQIFRIFYCKVQWTLAEHHLLQINKRKENCFSDYEKEHYVVP